MPKTAIPEPPETKQPYTMGSWNGFPQWRCKQCPFDTLDGEAMILDHIYRIHILPNLPPEPPPPLIPVYDKWGNLVTPAKESNNASN